MMLPRPPFPLRVGRRAAVLALLSWLAAAPAGAAPGAPEVVLEEGRLTADLEEVPLIEVLDEIARQTGAEIWGELENPHDVTIRLSAVPLSRALDRLLGEQNFALRFGTDGSVTVVELLGLSEPRTPRKGGTRRRGNALGTLRRGLSSHPPVRLTPRLATALRKSEVRLPRLLSAVARFGDTPNGQDAMRLFLHAVERDAEMTRAMRDIAPKMLAGFLRARARTNAVVLGTYLVRRAQNAQVRGAAARALALLQQPTAKR